MEASQPQVFDCVIVGAGPAGLSAAVNLARLRRSVLVVDERDRFLWVHTAHNYLGFPDGVEGAELRRLGWRQAARFGVRLLLGHVAEVTRGEAALCVRVEALPDPATFRPPEAPDRDAEMARFFGDVPGGSMEAEARSMILAPGVRGHFPEFPGRDACVGKSLFWCIQCSGYESIDRAVAVVGHTDDAVETALDLLDFTDRVTLVAGRPEGFAAASSRMAEVAASGIPTHPVGVARFDAEDGRIRALVLDDATATRIQVEQVYTVRETIASTGLARLLGVELDAAGQIVVTTDQRTNVPRVYAAGDATCLNDHQISAAVHEGSRAAFTANYELRVARRNQAT